MSNAYTHEHEGTVTVVVFACENCGFFMHGVLGTPSGDVVLEDEQTHRERYPAHRIASERHPLKAESGRWTAIEPEREVER